MLVDIVINILSYLTLIGDLFLIFSIIIFIANKKILKNHSNLIKKNNVFFAFIVASIATSGSLFFSEVAGFEPCRLCWYQRIFMYPLVLLIGISLWKKEDIKRYILLLAGIGSSISLYHYFIQVKAAISYVSGVCDINGVSCASDPIFKLGYITIPMMALTAFLMIIVLLAVYHSEKTKTREH